MLPHKLKNFVLYVDGVGYAGECEEITTPKLTRKMEEYRSGGMDAPVEIDVGMDKLSMELTLGESVPALTGTFGATTIDAVKIRLMGSAESDDLGQVIPVEIVCHGRFTEIDMGNWKPGDSNTTKYTCAISYFKYISNSKDILEIDVPKMILKADGKDIYAARRKALGMTF